MKKIIVSIILIFTLSVTFIGCSGRKANPASDFEYSLGEETAIIKKYIGKSKDVVIPEEIDGLPVTKIYIGAFAESDIESVYIPDTVTAIMNFAFASCKNLHTVDMGNGVEWLVESAFQNCTKLENLKLSANLKHTEAEIFSGCTSLKKLHIPKSLNVWGSEIFFGCPITTLTFEDGIENIGGYATMWNNGTLKEVTFPASVKKLGEWTFSTGVEHAYFKGDAPEFGKKPFGESKVTIHYKKGTKGWDNTGLEEWYTLVED